MVNGKLKIDRRRAEILSMLRRDGKVYVTQLSEQLQVTPVTVRNDLDVLEKEGALLRMNGGAVELPHTEEDPLIPKDISRRYEKERIADTVARMVKDGATLFINSGSTTGLIAARLREHKRLNIVTNSLAVANLLGDVPSFRVILLGGEINTNYHFTYGSDAGEQLERYRSDMAILSVDGVDAEGGITTYHAEEALIDRLMMSHAAKVVVAADHTKLSRTGFNKVCDCQENITLITDRCVAAPDYAELTAQGVTVIEA